MSDFRRLFEEQIRKLPGNEKLLIMHRNADGSYRNYSQELVYKGWCLSIKCIDDINLLKDLEDE